MHLHDKTTRHISFYLEWQELKELLLNKFKNNCKCGFNENLIKISIEQETEGSPSYNVSKWKVKIIADVSLD